MEVGSPAKGSRMLGWSGQLPDGQETSVGWEQDGLGWGVGSTNGICPFHLLDGCGLLSRRGWCSVWKEKCVQG